LSRRNVLLGAGGLAVGAIAAAGCGSTRPAAGTSARLEAGTLLWRTTLPSGVINVTAAAGTLCAQTGSIVRGLTASNGKDAWSLSGDRHRHGQRACD
jgi:hypothetical protein